MAKQNRFVEKILKDDWYKTATEQEMRIALMHLQQSTIDVAMIRCSEAMKEERDDIFERVGW